jgi:formylglycine-generating enzyme required for sulfatase activity
VLDMAGNVWEWCLNKLEQPGIPNAVFIDDTDSRRVIHGGSWVNDPGSLRSSFRFGDNADFRFRNIGFRLAQELE